MNTWLAGFLVSLAGLGGVIAGRWNSPESVPTNHTPQIKSYSFTGTIEDVRDDGYAMIRLTKVVGVKIKGTFPQADDFEAGRKFAIGKTAIISAQLPSTAFIDGFPASMESESISVEGVDLAGVIINGTSLTVSDAESGSSGRATRPDSNASRE